MSEHRQDSLKKEETTTTDTSGYSLGTKVLGLFGTLGLITAGTVGIVPALGVAAVGGVVYGVGRALSGETQPVEKETGGKTKAEEKPTSPKSTSRNDTLSRDQDDKTTPVKKTTEKSKVGKETGFSDELSEKSDTRSDSQSNNEKPSTKVIPPVETTKPVETKPTDKPIPAVITWKKPADVTYVPTGFPLTIAQLSATVSPPGPALVYEAAIKGQLKVLQVGDRLDAGGHDLTVRLASLTTHTAAPVTMRLTVAPAQALITWRLNAKTVTVDTATYTLDGALLNATFKPDGLAHEYVPAAGALLDADDKDHELTVRVTDPNYEAEKTLPLTVKLSKKGKITKGNTDDTPRDPNVIGYRANDSALYDIYVEVGGVAPKGQFYSVCAPDKAGGHYVFRGKTYDMYHNSSGSKAKGNSRTAWTILVNKEIRVVGVGYHTGDVTYRAKFPNATDNSIHDCGPSSEMTDRER